MFRNIFLMMCILGTSVVWSQQEAVEAKICRGDIGFFTELSIPCQVHGAWRETFGGRLSLLDNGTSAPRTDLGLDHTHYGLDIGLLWGTRSELIGLGVGGLGYWAQRAKGVTVGFLSGAAVEMDGIHLAL